MLFISIVDIDYNIKLNTLYNLQQNNNRKMAGTKKLKKDSEI